MVEFYFMVENDDAEGPKRRKLEDLRGRLVDQLVENQQELQEAREAELDPESGWEEKSSGAFGRNLVLLFGSLILVALLAWGIIVKLSPHEQRVEVPVRQKSFIESATMEEISKEVEEVVERYMKAKTTEERAEEVVDGANILPRMKEFEAREGVAIPQGLRSISAQVNSATSGLPIVGVQATDEEGTVWSLSLVPGVGKMLIDWESSVSYGEMSWSAFLKERPEETKLMRIYALRFINEADQGKGEPPLYYRLSHRFDAGQLIAEPARGSETEVDLKILVPQSMVQPLTVLVRFEEGKPFAQIVELVHPIWVDTDRVERLLYE
ncbi:MAG: hypothetical protein QNK83_12635 [Akkermansiaceae bacterium]